MEQTAAVDGFDPVVLRLAAAFYAPTKESNHLDSSCAQAVGELALIRYGLELPVTIDDLPKVAYYIAEAGVPDEKHLGWAEQHGIEGPVREGIAYANGVAQRHAAALYAATSTLLTKDKRVLQAVYKLARRTHDTEIRKAGTPYIDHVRRVGGLVLNGLEAVRDESGMADDDFTLAAVILGLAHDIREKETYSPDSFNLADPYAKFTPLCMRHLLDRISNPHGIALANSLRLATHYPKRRDWTPTYEEYIHRLTIELLARLGKFCDIHDNRTLEPKPPTNGSFDSKLEIDQKNREYDRAKWQLRNPIPQESIMPLVALWLTHYFDKIEEATATDVSHLLRALDSYMGVPYRETSPMPDSLSAA